MYRSARRTVFSFGARGAAPSEICRFGVGIAVSRRFLRVSAREECVVREGRIVSVPWFKFNSVLEFPFCVDPAETSHWVEADTPEQAETVAHEQHLDWVHNTIGSGYQLVRGPLDVLPVHCDDEDCPGCREDGCCLPEVV